TSYTASITLTAGTDYEFTDSTTATVNGNPATGVTKNADGTLTVTYAFSATAKDKLTSITAPQAITVANGTAYSAMNLPATVGIVTEGNTVTNAPVTWNTTTPANGSYDPAVLTQQTVTLTGTVTCPDGINDNGIPLTTTITITISAADIVGAPTANPTAGTYTENQSVSLTSSTEGATIYYTTDGNEPTLAGGVPGGTTQKYTAPISVTGTEGQSVQTTIKAIAVKNGMQDSSVETFSYTIQIQEEDITPDPDPVDYDILDGANRSWTQNSDGSLSIRGSGAFSKFVGVKVDGNLVDAKNYTVKEGSTIVTLKADYLNTLSVGSHTFEILWTDDSAGTSFTINADISDNGNNNQNNSSSDNNNSTPYDDKTASDTDKDNVPDTGDSTSVAWLFVLVGISGTGLILTTKKRRRNPYTSGR
ncbi:MAG: chitobiase/beta-hexosaminidase C-terminal domain-containing protein, partial [Clostridiales bacterium]|nr:chitobiase/beta-hexosaminidase C-terminal domain-containing protein [Clostridiales bacterium]